MKHKGDLYDYNGKKTKNSYKVSNGDVITVEEYKPKEDIKLKPQKMDLDVIYEDEDIIIINKEKGIVVHPGNGNPDGTLANAILERCKESLSGIGGTIRPGIALSGLEILDTLLIVLTVLVRILLLI